MPIIDVHAHLVPADYLAAMHAAGVHDVEGFPLPPWSEDAHLATMDRNGITASILSISAPGVSFTGGQAARDLARRINEAAAERRARSNGRFGAFALLTLPDVDGALAEMAYALDVLKLDGVGLLTNVGGTYLGDPAFEALFAEADRRGAVVYTHPVAPPGYEKLVLGYAASALEYPFDTTRMLLNLVASGTLRRYPNLRLIASHGGGAVPYLAWRMASISPYFNRLDPPITPGEIEAQLKAVYYDCTAVSNAVSLPTYTAFVPPQRRLFGSDTPFMPEASIQPALGALAADLSPVDLAALHSGNAAALFPELVGLLGL